MQFDLQTFATKIRGENCYKHNHKKDKCNNTVKNKSYFFSFVSQSSIAEINYRYQHDNLYDSHKNTTVRRRLH